MSVARNDAQMNHYLFIYSSCARLVSIHSRYS